MSVDPAFQPVHELAGEKSKELVERYLSRIEKHGERLHAFVAVYADDAYRMDVDALEEVLHTLGARKQPVIACVSVIGTTEESAVDNLDRVVEIRDWAAEELGMALHLHADAAYGGYAAAVTRNADGSRRSYKEVRGEFERARKSHR